MGPSQPSHSLCPVPYPPHVLTGVTLGRSPYQSLSRMRRDAGSTYRRLRPPRYEVGTIPAAGLELAAFFLAHSTWVRIVSPFRSASVNSCSSVTFSVQPGQM